MKYVYNTAVVLKNRIDDSYNFKPLPAPSAKPPYRLHIERIIGEKTSEIQEKMSFHVVGDTGSVKHSDFQSLVASTLAKQLTKEKDAYIRPSFFYHLGDVVYNYGEAHEYPSQFFKPYRAYDAPIFAIPGNHDADINPNARPYNSLDAFTAVFCDTKRRKIHFAAEKDRLSMIQPNVYWTLETPLARFIGLYPNVNKFGMIDDEQRAWFVNELHYAKQKQDKEALIVCLHHSPYSADNNHGSSLAMIELLESAFLEAEVKPDIVLSGHVHNYQRFMVKNNDDTTTTYVVAGAGGYADLHKVALLDDKRVEAITKYDKQVELQTYCDDRFGFLKIDIKKTANGLQLAGSYYCFPKTYSGQLDMEPTLYDKFEVPIQLNKSCLNQSY